MKTLTFFAFLLIATFVNSSKMVCYSDVAQSLLELHAGNDEISARLNAVNESFRASHKSLEAVKSGLDNSCKRLVAANTSNLEALKKRIQDFQAKNQGMVKANEALSAENVRNKALLETEKNNKRKLKEEVKKGLTELNNKRLEIQEVLNILRRLRNFALDELNATTKRNSEMTNYSVVSKNGVSFIETSNLQEELRSIMKKSEVTSKSLISTLIFMTQVQNRSRFTDPKLLNKVIALLQKITYGNSMKLRNLGLEYKRNSEFKNKLVETSRKLILNLRQSMDKNLFTISLNNMQTNANAADVVFLQRALSRRQKDAGFQNSFCANQQSLIGKYFNRYTQVSKRLDGLRKLN